MRLPKPIPVQHKEVALANSGHNMKEIAHKLSNSGERSNLKAHLVDLLIELGLARKTTDQNKMLMISMMLQRRCLENALEYILQQWIQRFGEAANLNLLAAAFKNIGLPGAHAIIYNMTYQETSKNSSGKISKDQFEPQREPNNDFYGTSYVYYRKPMHPDLISNDETDHLLDVKVGRCQKDYQISETVSLHSRKGFLKSMSSILFALICFQIVTAFTIHLTMKIDGPRTTNATLIFEHLHDHYDQFRSDLQSGIKKILDATYYEEYNVKDSKVLHVTSYLEYQKKVYQYSRHVNALSVFIDVNAMENWPYDVSLGESKKITKLGFRGNLTFKLVSSILKETKNLQALVLKNKEKGICDTWNGYSNVLINETQTILPELRIIYFENFHTCSKVYDTFSKNLVLRKLHEIHFINGTIDDDNRPSIQHFIRAHGNTLKSLYFNTSKLNSQIFDKNMPTLPFVTMINLDFIGDQNGIFIRNTFSQIFPNLRNFVSKRGHISLSQVLRLFDCEHLIGLKTGITVDERKTRLNLDFLRNAPETLKKISISFKFLNKTGSDICEIEGYDEESKRFSSFEIRANCDKRYI